MQASHANSQPIQMTRGAAPIAFGSSVEGIGIPTYFDRGELAGRTLRLELVEVQKADRGRRYAVKDRRPLDPPPIVRLRMFGIQNAATQRQGEREYDDLQDTRNCGFLCHVDLFPVPNAAVSQEQCRTTTEADDDDDDEESTPVASPALSEYLPFSGTTLPPLQGLPPVGMQTSIIPILPPGPSFVPARWPAHNAALAPPTAVHVPTMPGIYPGPLPGGMTGGPPPRCAGLPPPSAPWGYGGTLQRASVDSTTHDANEVVGWYGDYPITAGSVCTALLVGERFIEASTVPWEGKRVGMFVFGDLAVRSEGTFVLRYRLFNIFSCSYGEKHPRILAECFGGPFRVYSTKTFPGLGASTDLTKYLSFSGARANMREKERKKKVKDTKPKSGPSTPTLETEGQCGAGSKSERKGKSKAVGKSRVAGATADKSLGKEGKRKQPESRL